ncbi:MAG: di-heme oxidoredictase family protein [Longimicrobiales bacterium]
MTRRVPRLRRALAQARRLATGLLLPLVSTTGCVADGGEGADVGQGGSTGDTTGAATARLGDPVPGLSDAERGRFLLGRALFERLATPEEGLGPLYNAQRCSDCHDAPAVGGGGDRVPVRKVSRFADGRCSLLRDRGGDNLQQRVSPALAARGFGAETDPAEATGGAWVIAPPLFGPGLLAAVSAADLEAAADPDDRDGDGIRGRLARLDDGSPAPFGRKGDAVSVRDFVEQALLFELGFTSPRFPDEEAHNGVPLPADVDPMPDPEMTERAVTLLTDYVRYLAPPAPAVVTGPAADTVARGEAVFTSVGCVGCHTPTLRTGSAPEAVLADVEIHPWSDLLLHDLGYGDGDLCTPRARPGEYRTAPLWGLRHRSRYLHDGSATTVGDAVRRHGGEAAAAVGAFQALSEADRRALVRFLMSL